MPRGVYPRTNVLKDWKYIDAVISKKYPKAGAKIATELGLSKSSLYIRASRMGVRFTAKRTLTEETKRKIGEAISKIPKTDIWKRHLSESIKSKPYNKKRIKLMIEGLKRSRKLPRKKTKPERQINEILKFMFRPFKVFSYTGNRKYWVKFKNGKFKNPDFVQKGEQKAIEVFGRYWHRNDDPIDLIKAYNDVGWNCLVIWEDEINSSTRDRIMEFAYPYEYAYECQEM